MQKVMLSLVHCDTVAFIVSGNWVIPKLAETLLDLEYCDSLGVDQRDRD